MMKSVQAAAVLAVLLASAPAGATTLSPIDGRFAVAASVSNTFEIKSSRLALQRSRNPEIRAFARWMIHDHTAAQAKLQRTNASSGGAAAPSLDAMHENKLAQLAGLDGAAFDEAYVAEQVEAHRDTARTLADYAQMGVDPALLHWARMTLPAVQIHLYHFEALSHDR